MMSTATTSQHDEQSVIEQRPDVHEPRGETSARDVSTFSSPFERRAIALAKRRHYAPADTMHWSTTRDGNASYLVHADSRDDPYSVSIHPETDRQHTCDCPARGPCKHIGEALRLWQRFDRACWLHNLAEQKRYREFVRQLTHIGSKGA